jgi:hypothetical protein
MRFKLLLTIPVSQTPNAENAAETGSPENKSSRISPAASYLIALKSSRRATP